MEDNFYRMTLRIPRPFHQEIRKIAYEQEESQNGVVIMMLKKFIEDHKKMLTVPKNVT